MELSVIPVDIANVQHRKTLAALFDEYASSLDVALNPNVVEHLFRLAYFHGFIGYADNLAAGFAVCFESYSTYRSQKVMNIHDFMVTNKLRNNGVGKALLDGIEQYCLEHNYLKITLEVDDDNIAAKNLYQSCDYQDYRVVLTGLHHWQKYLD